MERSAEARGPGKARDCPDHNIHRPRQVNDHIEYFVQKSHKISHLISPSTNKNGTFHKIEIYSKILLIAFNYSLKTKLTYVVRLSEFPA